MANGSMKLGDEARYSEFDLYEKSSVSNRWLRRYRGTLRTIDDQCPSLFGNMEQLSVQHCLRGMGIDVFRTRPQDSARLLAPLGVISKEGLVLPRFTSQLIPWTAVKEITFRSVGKRNAQVMVLLLRDDLPANLREVVARRRYPNYRKDGTVVTVVPWSFSGMSEAGIIEAIQRYYREFGTAHPAA